MQAAKQEGATENTELVPIQVSSVQFAQLLTAGQLDQLATLGHVQLTASQLGQLAQQQNIHINPNQLAQLAQQHIQPSPAELQHILQQYQLMQQQVQQQQEMQQASIAAENLYGRLTNFEIERKIGKGQFSVVYRARCKMDGTIVALKKVQVKFN